MARSSVHLLTALCATIVLASPAAAAEPDYGDLGGGVPGRSALDQYREAVPSGGGPAKLSQAQRTRLAEGDAASRGYVGVLTGVAQTGIVGVDAKPGDASREDGSRSTDRRSESRSTVEAGVAPDGDASLGPVPLWLAVVVTATVAFAAAVVRWRRTT